MKVKDFYQAIKNNPSTKFKFDLSDTRYSFGGFPEVTGVATLESATPWPNIVFMRVGGYTEPLSFDVVEDLELYEEEDILNCTKQVALVDITQEVKYTVVIKGTTFNFTQEELDALAEELLGFTTL